MGFTPHKAKQPLLGMDLQGERKKEKRNLEGLSNGQRSQMHAYVVLKKMKIVDYSSKKNNMKVQNFTI